MRAEPLSYARDIRPILAGNCFKCHGNDPDVRQYGLRLDTREGATATLKDGAVAVVPGAPEKSKMIELVSTDDLGVRMPPVEVNQHGLSAEQIGLLRRWIREGAAWGTHWSWVATEKKPAPRVSDAKWCRSDMDRWVMVKLDQEGLRPSPEASRETLIRRVSLDLIGLPPTPAEVEAFVSDKSADAYERVVDRLLASPRFGEKWARWWLDMARYADTKGYEKDARRTMWPYRDWVIRSLNADMSFDRFTLEQLAGDMLPGATQDQQIATSFHRNTMTNDEGGTDNEEFRTAAVIDRVNTTMEIWQGLTMGCAQCHTHKYDPIRQVDYYRMFAIFNNTEDADGDPETPFLRIVKPESEGRLKELEAAIPALQKRIDDAVAAVDAAAHAQADLPAPSALAQQADRPWLDDMTPAGAKLSRNDEPAAWPWYMPAGASDVQPQAGVRCFRTSYTGTGQVFLAEAMPRLAVAAGEKLYAYVYLDAKRPPKSIMLQWFSTAKGWSHRAYWGTGDVPYAKEAEGTPARLRIGDLPKKGEWVRLEVDAKAVDLEGEEVQGWAFSQHDGTVYWDNAGVVSARAIDERYRESLAAWCDVERGRKDGGVPEDVRRAVDKPAGEWNDEEKGVVRAYYLRNVHAPTLRAIAADDTALVNAESERDRIHAESLSLPVMHELQGGARRTTHRFVRGSFLNPAEEVTPGIPEMFAGTSAAEATNREELARWLTSEGNPLTARVIANRLWEQLWGAGIVDTTEDLGTQGSWPTDQELLDHLAIRLREGGWSVKKFLRYVVTSAAYRQASAATPELLGRDAYNRLLARGPRVRLEGEVIRDQALAASGLLSAKMFGPPVFPPQPDGLWIIIYSNDRWMTSKGEDRYRRGVYTFWRRTVPHPAMTTFDAPSREFCVSRRIRTNTPLQSLVTLNDPEFVECAQAMARRVLREGGGSDRERMGYAMRLVVARGAEAQEEGPLLQLLDDERAHYGADTDAAGKAATSALGPLPEGVSVVDAAAWTAVCNVLLNLDEALTKE